MQVETLAEQLLFTTLRIETETSEGRGTGTAFIYSYEWDSRTALFAVTNKHVIADAKLGHFFFTLRAVDDKPLIGQRFDLRIDNFETQWHGHPRSEVDVALMPPGPILEQINKMGKRVFVKTIADKLIPSEDQLAGLDAIEEVLFVGYPNGMFDAMNLTPIVRRGITATPVQLDYNGQPTFLLDGSVFPGSSGSPVSIANTGGYSARGVGFAIGARSYLLGVMAP